MRKSQESWEGVGSGMGVNLALNNAKPDNAYQTNKMRLEEMVTYFPWGAK